MVEPLLDSTVPRCLHLRFQSSVCTQVLTVTWAYLLGMVDIKLFLLSRECQPVAKWHLLLLPGWQTVVVLDVLSLFVSHCPIRWFLLHLDAIILIPG
jgi:hypothetical protein